MNLLGFTLVSIIGRGLRFFIVATALMLFGEKIKANLELIIILVSILIVIFYIVVSKWQSFKKIKK